MANWLVGTARTGTRAAYIDGVLLDFDTAGYSGDTNSVLVSQTGQALVVDATTTTTVEAGAWWAWDLVDTAGREVDWPASFQGTVGLSVIPPANSDIEVAIYLADDSPDPAVATNVVWASLRYDGAQNDPDFDTSHTAAVAAADAVQAHFGLAIANWLSSGNQVMWCRAITAMPLEADSEKAIATAQSANPSFATQADKWYVGVIVASRSGAGGATDALTVVAHYTSQQGTI